MGPELGMPHHCGPRYLPLPIAGDGGGGALDSSLEDLLTRVDEFVDILKAFVGMVDASVARMEEQVAKAEAELRTWPSTSREALLPGFLNFSSCALLHKASPEAPADQLRTPSCSDRRARSLSQWKMGV